MPPFFIDAHGHTNCFFVITINKSHPHIFLVASSTIFTFLIINKYFFPKYFPFLSILCYYTTLKLFQSILSLSSKTVAAHFAWLLPFQLPPCHFMQFNASFSLLVLHHIIPTFITHSPQHSYLGHAYYTCEDLLVCLRFFFMQHAKPSLISYTFSLLSLKEFLQGPSS